jgi:asparagine synthase (glutamine-hydrolysing)
MTAAVAPGVYGVVGRDGQPSVPTVFDRIMRRCSGPLETEALVDPQGEYAIGRCHLGVLQPSPQLQDGAAVQVLFHGDLHNTDEVRRRIDPGDPRKAGSTSALVGALYEQLGPAFVSELDGAFALAVVDARRRRLVLATDAIGSYPLYWASTTDGLVFGSNVGALLAHPGVRNALNPAAVADFVTFGFPLATRTLSSAVSMVAAGSVLTYDWADDTRSLVRHADFVEWFEPWTGSHTDYLDALVDAFRRSVDRAMSPSGAVGLALSGGLDSRAILSAVNGHGAAVQTYTLGVKACADQVIADRLSKIARTNHTFFELDDRYLQEFLPNLRRLVDLTDGMYVSHGLTEMLALEFLSKPRFSILLRGHGGELAKTSLAWPFHTDERIAACRSTSEFVRYLLNRTSYIGSSVDVGSIFTDPWSVQVRDAAVESVTRALERVALAPVDLCSYLYLAEHHRRVTVSSLAVFRTAVDVRLPFVDATFLRVLFRGQPGWRSDTTIHRALTSAGNDDLLRVRNSNTGAPAGAGRLTELLLDKVNSAFKRLNVPGYRHYHNFQAWMRDQLLATVESVLLSRTSLDRGMLQERGIRRLVDDTRSGRVDHSYFLQTLLILELWQQQHA